MKRIGDMFSSKARTEILRVLNDMNDGAGLRQTARLAGVHPHSAELVLEKLINERLATCKRKGNRKLYQLNHDHEDVPFLKAVFKALVNASIQNRSKSLQEKGKTIIPFIDDASSMLRHARRSINVTKETL